MTQTEVDEKIEDETMETRVSMDHPFFAGMKIAQLALLTDCAIPVHFKERRESFFARAKSPTDSIFSKPATSCWSPQRKNPASR